MHTIEIEGQVVRVTRCPTAFCAPTHGGMIPARDRKVLHTYIDRQIAEADPQAWMRKYANAEVPKP
jgi:hypothetical protein